MLRRFAAFAAAAALAAVACQAGCQSAGEENPEGDAGGSDGTDWIEQWRMEIKEHERLSRERAALLPKYMDMVAGEDADRRDEGASRLLGLESKEKGFVYDRVLELLPLARKPGAEGRAARGELSRMSQIIRLAQAIETGDRTGWAETAQVMGALGRQGEAAAAVKLILKLESESMLDIQAAQEALRLMGAGAARFLIVAIKSELVKQAVKQRCVDVLSGVKEAAASLAELLSNPRPNVRYMGATALGAGKDAKAVPALGDALGREDNPLVACAMLKAMGDIGDAAASPCVRRMIDSGDPSIVKFAAAAAAALGDKASLPALAAALGRLAEDPDPMVRDGILKALRRLSGRNLGDDASKWKAAYPAGGR